MIVILYKNKAVLTLIRSEKYRIAFKSYYFIIKLKLSFKLIKNTNEFSKYNSKLPTCPYSPAGGPCQHQCVLEGGQALTDQLWKEGLPPPPHQTADRPAATEPQLT